MSTIEIIHEETKQVGKTEIKLPFYYAAGKFSKHYCCFTEEGKLVQVFYNTVGVNMDTYQYDLEDIGRRIQKDMLDDLYAPVSYTHLRAHETLS
jgi:hypothetical protein